MAIIKEYREFFLRDAQVNSGVKLDQELGFDADYTVIVDGVPTLVKNRYLKDHYPSEAVNKKLFESITFKLNPEDAAQDGVQGLVRTAPDGDIPLRKTPNADYSNDGFIRAVQPHQIPDIVAGTNVTISTSTVSDDGKTRQVYTINASGGGGSPTVEGEILHWNYFDSQTISGSNPSEQLFSSFNGFSIPAGYLETGDTIEIEAFVNNSYDEYVDTNGQTVQYQKIFNVKLGSAIMGLTGATASTFFAFGYQNKFRIKLTVVNDTTVFCEINTSQALPSFIYALSLMVGQTGSVNTDYHAKDQLLTIPDHTANALPLLFSALINDHTGSLEMYAAKVKINKVRN